MAELVKDFANIKISDGQEDQENKPTNGLQAPDADIPKL
jgi:hypothetical protein